MFEIIRDWLALGIDLLEVSRQKILNTKHLEAGGALGELRQFWPWYLDFHMPKTVLINELKIHFIY